MKDRLLTVAFNKGELKIWHSSQMGSLQDIFKLGNAYRAAEGKPVVPLATWVQRQDVKEYVQFLSERLGRPAMETRTGRSGGTYAHLNILIDAATSISVAFKDEVYNTFINSRLLILRDDSGEGFKDLNAVLALHAEAVLGKPAHNGHYITVAKALRAKILPEGHPGWDFASSDELRKRSDVEAFVSKAISMKLVKDWDELKDLIERL